MEGVTETAQAYYEWTDSLTPEPNDGKAMFGRDAMANFFFAGSEQLGVDPITFEDGQPVLNFDHDAVRRLWDNYYVPFIKGYFTEEEHTHAMIATISRPARSSRAGAPPPEPRSCPARCPTTPRAIPSR